jgi:hypothetical protein
MDPKTSKARTNESLAEDLDRASALIGEAMTDAHSHGVVMLEQLEKLESQGLLAAGSSFLVRSDSNPMNKSTLAMELTAGLLHLARGSKS